MAETRVRGGGLQDRKQHNSVKLCMLNTCMIAMIADVVDASYGQVSEGGCRAGNNTIVLSYVC